MTIPVHAGTPVVFVGDSITAQGWFSANQSLVGGTNLLVEQLSPAVNGPARGSVVSGSRAASVVNPVANPAINPVYVGGRIVFVNSGVSGNKVADLATNVATRITNYNPSVIVIEVGVNDVTGGSGVQTPLVNFAASYDSLLSQIRTWSSTVSIVCLSVFTWGEQWTPGPPLAWDNSATGSNYDDVIPGYNSAIQTKAALYNATYVDNYSAALTAESIQNTPAPGVIEGVLTLDHVHPTAAGQLVMSSNVATVFSFT